jgi:hypothetical protein
MSDITKGYTFSDSKADWASEKDTALRLNKMVDDAKVNLVAGTNVTISRGSNGITINSTGSGGGGDVVGPSSSVNDKVVFFNGTTGKLIKDSGLSLSGSNTGDQTISLTGDVTGSGNGSFVTSIAAGVIVDADINASAAIADTKLATISTASKVSNSATTATSSNTASAIVARNASGNFSAGTITANLTGNVSGSSGSTTGNAATATALATARAINGVNFDGSAPITITAAGSTLSDTVPVAKGGTGQTTVNAAINALLPSQSGASGKNLQSNGTDVSWVAAGGSGTVTAVSVTTVNGVSGTVLNPNTTPAISLTLGAVTPTSVNGVVFSGSSSPTLSVTGASSVQGTNTGDNAVNSNYSGLVTNATHSGDATGSGALTLATVNSNVGSFTAANITVNAKGLITSAANGVPTTIQVTNDETTAADHYPVFMPAGSSPYSAGAKVSGAKLSFRPSTGRLDSIEYVGNVSSATVVGAATGSTSRTLSAYRGDVFNVRDFGATGNGSTDDTSFISAAIDAALASANGGAVYFPSGTYKLSSLITRSTIAKTLTLFGDGDCSEIRMHSSSGAFNFTSTTDYVTFEFCSLRMAAYANGPCLTITCAPASTTHTRNMLKVSRVNMVSYFVGATLTNYFTRGIVMSLASNAIISDCLFEGGVNNSNGNRAIEISSVCVNTLISNTNLNFWEYGVHCGVYQEGVCMNNVVMVYVKIGLYQYVASSALRSTLFALSNTHIDARGANSYAIQCNNLDGLQLNGCYFIAGDGCASLTQVFQSTITGSYFFMAGNYGIKLFNSNPSQNDDAGNQISCLAVTIIGNTFHGTGNSVILETLCMNCLVQNNTRATRSGTSPYRPDMTNLNLNTSDATGGTRGNVIQA